ncbi:MAG: SDR family NAD(P)-dependent oxidoreductase [Gammaproteobacteria bacterium]
MNKIIVSGSTSGIGRSIAEKLLAENYEVVGLGRDHSKFQSDSRNYHPYVVDFSDITTLEVNLKKVAQDHPDSLGLICSAGFGRFGELEQFSVSQMQEMMNVNFLSQAVLAKVFLPGMKKREEGKVIFIGSEAALSGEKKGSIYCASKFALRGFSQSIRKECANANISVTMINPGFVDTPFFDRLNFQPEDPKQHAISPSSISDAVLHVLQAEPHCVFEEINLQPLRKRVKQKMSS